MSSTLVTGATGFTGGHLARGLLARGDKVRVLVRERERAHDLEAAGVDIVVGDLRDRWRSSRRSKMSTLFTTSLRFIARQVPRSRRIAP